MKVTYEIWLNGKSYLQTELIDSAIDTLNTLTKNMDTEYTNEHRSAHRPVYMSVRYSD